ncbi:polysaccharide (de)acetylase [Cloacibacterium caeni]|uniref:polysaccharide (de)acetylase n=1 Tax=Cloacibacterium caeni TaxID=2004710 RepID=UPI0020225441|nr:polysaccharide (de)acetylase [Cloacibacterium caeni]
MYTGNKKSELRIYVSNLFGWRTNRKLIVIESDDWGSVYMSDKRALEEMKTKGIPLHSHYLKNDTLESNEDMEMLMEVLRKHKDSSGRHVVMTGVNVVANPNFEKIKANGFTKYEYELFTETAKRFPQSNKIHTLWKQGIEERLLVPVFHGREHLNVQRWMKLLQEGNETVRIAFEYGVSTLPREMNGDELPDLRAAFDIDTQNDLKYLEKVIDTGLDEFEALFGYKSTFFIPTNGPFNNNLEELLSKKGVKYIGTGKIQSEPLGEGKYKKHFRYLGKKNRLGQMYLTRNCFFEPNSEGFPIERDWVSSCLKEIEVAFNCRKPATISSHRVNYMGSINPENRERGLKKLDNLLVQIIKKWPEVEFITSMELGDIITGKTQEK